MNVNNEGLFQFLAETTSPCFPSASTFNLLWKLTCWITFKFFIVFQYLYFSAEFSQSCFKRVLIGSAAISALRLHQRLPVRLFFFYHNLPNHNFFRFCNNWFLDIIIFYIIVPDSCQCLFCWSCISSTVSK